MKMTKTMLLLVVITVLSSLAATSDAFLAPKAANTITPPSLLSSSSSSSWLSSSSSSGDGAATTITVISPPGGLGEMSAIESARLGGRVRWFVVSPPSSSSSSPTTAVSLASETLDAIGRSGGSLEFAGASADDLLSDAGGALGAVKSWCAGSGSVVCTYDGASIAVAAAALASSSSGGGAGAAVVDAESAVGAMRAGIRLAAREATRGVTGGRGIGAAIAILAAGEESDDGGGGDAGGGVVGGFGSMLAGLVGGDRKEGGSTTALLRTLSEAVTVGGGAATVIRFGDLFGAPESSVRMFPLPPSGCPLFIPLCSLLRGHCFLIASLLLYVFFPIDVVILGDAN